MMTKDGGLGVQISPVWLPLSSSRRKRFVNIAVKLNKLMSSCHGLASTNSQLPPSCLLIIPPPLGWWEKIGKAGMRKPVG